MWAQIFIFYTVCNITLIKKCDITEKCDTTEESILGYIGGGKGEWGGGDTQEIIHYYINILGHAVA
jgi:hypothetical protein